MDELVPILERSIGDAQHAVDARVLWQKLLARRDFSTWISSRISGLDLVEGVDYLSFFETTDPGSRENAGNLVAQPKREYVLTLDAAKHVALAERTPKGKEVRTYFIRCERALRERPMPSLDLATIFDSKESTLLLMAEALKRVEAERELRLAAQAEVATMAAQVEHVEAKLEEAKPALALEARFARTDGNYTLQNAGRALGMAPNGLIDRLKKAKALFYQGGSLVPKRELIVRGYFDCVPVTWDGRDGTGRSGTQTVVTPKGLSWILKHHGESKSEVAA